MNWEWLNFDQIDSDLMYRMLALRQAVFIVEQECPYLDADDKDQLGLHLIATDSDGQIAAYLRTLPPGISYPEPTIGRILTAQSFRQQGLGRIAVSKAIERIGQDHPGHDIRISAQEYLEKFYQDLGFATVSDVYLDVGIPHIDMLRPA